ncbi:glycoside hydrolase family 31 protein [Isoptericola sp. NPDC055881]
MTTTQTDPSGLSEATALTEPTECTERTERTELGLLPGERWWGGLAADGPAMPFGVEPHSRDLAVEAGTNQSAPVLVSSAGRYVWSARPFAFAFSGDRLALEGRGVVVRHPGNTLRDAYQAAARAHFPATGVAPARALFTGPQYNSWIQMPYRPSQDAVVAYVRELLDDGLPPGVVMVDDMWSEDYGVWEFAEARFPDPAAMVAELHALGCSVMLWVVPWISPDSAAFRELEPLGLLLRGADGQTVVRRWWNGLSALLDLSRPDAVDWMRTRLRSLQQRYGIDGFKMDGGDLQDYRLDDQAHGYEPVDMVKAWSALGEEFAFNEMRASWATGGRALAQRVQDKPPTWEAVRSLVPTMVAQGLLGMPFTCPDMVGGGEVGSMGEVEVVDQELFVRYAQVAALSPMMQFSLSPARALDDAHLPAVRAAVNLRQSLLPDLMELVDAAAATGEPVVRHMAYHAPGLEDVTDQYFLGPDLLVAPVVEPGATVRSVVLPDGDWRGASGETISGPATVEVPVGIDSIPVFRRV